MKGSTFGIDGLIYAVGYLGGLCVLGGLFTFAYLVNWQWPRENIWPILLVAMMVFWLFTRWLEKETSDW